MVTDEVGRSVKVPTTVKRIVTLAPDLTETIYALGLEDRLGATRITATRRPQQNPSRTWAIRRIRASKPLWRCIPT